MNSGPSVYTIRERSLLLKKKKIVKMFRSTLEQYPVAIGRSVSASGSQVQHEQLLLLFEVV